MLILLADLEQFKALDHRGDLPQHLVVGVFQLDGQGRLTVHRPHPSQLAALGQVEREDGLVLGLTPDADDGPRPVHKFGTPQPAVCHVADGLLIGGLLGLWLTFVVDEHHDAPRLLQHGLDKVPQEVGADILLG